jgi:hypothetical protein
MLSKERHQTVTGPVTRLKISLSAIASARRGAARRVINRGDKIINAYISRLGLVVYLCHITLRYLKAR